MPWLSLQGDLFGGLALSTDFGDRVLEFRHILETLVDRGKADVGDLVQTLELTHDKFTDVPGDHFTSTAGEKFFFDSLNGAIDCLGGHRAFAQGQHKAGPQFCRIELRTTAILLDHDRHLQLDAFVGSEPLIAMRAPTAAANGIPFLGHTGVDHLSVIVVAEGTFHGAAAVATVAGT